MCSYNSATFGEREIPAGLPLEPHELARTRGKFVCYRDKQGIKLPIEGDRLENLLKHIPLSFNAAALGLPDGTPLVKPKHEDWKLVSTGTVEASGDRYSVLRLENPAIPKLSSGETAYLQIFLTSDLCECRAVHVPYAPLLKEHRWFEHCRRVLEVQQQVAAKLADLPGYRRRFIPGPPTMLRTLLDHQGQRWTCGDQLM